MIRGKKYFFFKMSPCRKDSPDVYHIAESFEDLYLRFGSHYMSKFHSITKLNEVSLEHICAIETFLLQQIS